VLFKGRVQALHDNILSGGEEEQYAIREESKWPIL